MTPDPAQVRAWMEAALALARDAERAGEVPIGAVVAVDGRIAGRGHNRTIVDGDPTAHAEIVALREAARVAGNHRLTGAVLVATLEPCLMCVGAAVHARVGTLVHAADDPKAGALDVLRRRTAEGLVNHRIELVRGPLADESAELLRRFFRSRRGPRDGGGPAGSS